MCAATDNGGISSVGRALDCDSKGHRFETGMSPQNIKKKPMPCVGFFFFPTRAPTNQGAGDAAAWSHRAQRRGGTRRLIHFNLETAVGRARVCCWRVV